MLGPKHDLEIIVGTYEDYVVGYEAHTSTNKQHDTDKSATMYLEQSFAVRGHSGSVSCLASSPDGSFVCSAGYDEMINLLSLKRRKLVQTTENPVNCSTFVGNSHLLCGSEDSNIYIYECKSKEMKLVKTLKGHKAPVKSIDAHPSGKILLSIGKDQSMRTWNLIKGRCAYVTNIGTEAHLVKWSKTGNDFVIAANNEIYLYNNSGNLKHSIKMDKRVNSIEFITDRVFAVAIDSGRLEFFDLDVCKSLMRLDAHETRIKSVCCLVRSDNSKRVLESDEDSEAGGLLSPADCGKKTESLFATASSDGSIKVWSVQVEGVDKLSQPKEVARVDVGARLTSMIVSRRELGK